MVERAHFHSSFPCCGLLLYFILMIVSFRFLWLIFSPSGALLSGSAFVAVRIRRCNCSTEMPFCSNCVSKVAFCHVLILLYCSPLSHFNIIPPPKSPPYAMAVAAWAVTTSASLVWLQLRRYYGRTAAYFGSSELVDFAIGILSLVSSFVAVLLRYLYLGAS